MNRHSVLYILPVTQDVKPSDDGSWLETHQAVHYNLRVSNARISGHFVLVIACAPLLWVGACEKKTKPNDPGAVAALDNAAAPPVAENAADTTPLSGIDVSKLEGDKVKLFYKLANSLQPPCPEARSAAQAALAAAQQGKFTEMHDRLFAPQAAHGHDAVMGYAKDLGLDLAKFQKAYDDASPQVTADLKQGEDAGVDATPTLFFNDRKYEGPMVAKYIEMWIDEDLAVNR